MHIIYFIPYRLQQQLFIFFLYPKGYNMNITSLSEYVKSMRKEYGLTQVDLSEKSGVELRFVRELE